MSHNPTTAIKCHFSNEVHKLLEPNLHLKKWERWKVRKNLTDKEKLELFEKIMKLHDETSSELRAYQYKKRERKRIAKARIERGYVPKKKTKKEDYLKTAIVA